MVVEFRFPQCGTWIVYFVRTDDKLLCARNVVLESELALAS